MIEEDAPEVVIEEEEIEKGIAEEITIEMIDVGEMIEEMIGEMVTIEEEEDLSLTTDLKANLLLVNNLVSLQGHHLRNRCQVFRIMVTGFQLIQIKSLDLDK